MATPDKFVLVSSALDYDDSFERTIGVITAAQIRRVIAYSFLSINCKPEDVDFMFFVGRQRDSQGEANFIPKAHLLTLPAPNAKGYYSTRVQEAIKYMATRDDVNFVMLCEDDTFVEPRRFSTFCSQMDPDEMLAYGAADTNSDGGFNLGGGIILPKALIKAIAADEFYYPKENSYAEDDLIASIQKVGGTILPEPKLNASRSKRPSVNNTLITTHKQNVFDLVEATMLNFPN